MTDHDPENPTARSRFSTVTRYLRKHKGYLVVGGICIVLTNVLILILPYITKIIFDLLEKGTTGRELLRWVLLMVGLAVISGVFRFMQRRTVIWMSRKVEYELRRDIFDHLLKLSPSYYDGTRTGDIMARMTNDLEAVRMVIGPGIMHLISTVVTFVVAIAFMVYLSPRLTLFAMVPMLLFPLSVNRLFNALYKRNLRVQEHFSELTAAAQENLAGIRVVKAFRQEDAEIEHFRGMSMKYFALNLELARLNAMFYPLMAALGATLTLVVLYAGGRGVIDGDIPLGTLVAFFAYLTMLYWPAIAMGWVVSLYQRGSASLDRINSVLRTEPQVRDTVAEPYADILAGRIEFRNLTFAYDGAPVLQGIDLTIEPGQTVGIVGPTGSGKTTLVSLLARLYPVPRGMLFIDLIDINDWEIASLRRQIGFATQEPFLFSDSIGENILFGSSGARLTKTVPAARAAALHEDIEGFPEGYHTLVGERGITLSGGQKQRTAIARAILIDPAILILDDATSAVDTQTEDTINERIKDILKNRTAIIISHRVSSVKEADLILYLDGGRIVERGTHDELIALDGRYGELYRTQLIARELEAL